jgi:hypothetical protein
MPVIPLLHIPEHPDGWHQVTAPRGYERWTFEALDESGDIRLFASFSQGLGLTPAYLRRYRQYLGKPTRHAPPLPAEESALQAVVYERGELIASILSVYPPDEFRASFTSPGVQVGRSRFDVAAAGRIRLLLAQVGAEPQAGGLDAEVTFEAAGGSPRMCTAAGTVHIKETASRPARTIALRGLGSYDHAFATHPPNQAAMPRLRGCLLLPDRTVTFEYLRSHQRGANELMLRYDHRQGGGAWIPPSCGASWRRGITRAGYPVELNCGKDLLLTSPKKMNSTAFSTFIFYDAQQADWRGRALCELIHPRHFGRESGLATRLRARLPLARLSRRR